MVTIKISRVDARRLCVLLAGDIREYREDIADLEKIKAVDPGLGMLHQTTEHAIETTQQMIDTIERVLEQIRD